MAIPVRKTVLTGIEEFQWMVTDDGSRTLRRGEAGETYHSGCGAMAESLHVYLYNSGVAQRLAQGSSTRVFELGFGTGTAFLLTAALAELSNTRLSFDAVDSQLLPVELYQSLQLQEALQSFASPAFDELLSGMQHTWDDFVCRAGDVHRKFCEELNRHSVDPTSATREIEIPAGKNVNLRLHLRSFSVPWFDQAWSEDFDSIYFDPFSPKTCPDLWQPQVFRSMCQALNMEGRLTTYCVKGEARRMMEASGFAVQRVAGPPGGKREVLIASPRSSA